MKRSLDKSNEGYFLKIALVFTVLLVAMRVVGMLGPQSFRPLLPAGFVIMAALPFLFLLKEGRKQIGLQKPIGWKYFLVAAVAGAVMALLLYIIGLVLFGRSDDNWYITILNFYKANPSFQSMDGLVLQFVIFTVPAMIFSPIAEELFFRGFLHQVLQLKYGQQRATWFECVLFGAVHLAHHGIYPTEHSYGLHLFSGLLWVAGMAATAWVFAWLRHKSQSIYIAMVAHASFNFFMNYLIFFYLV